MPKDVTASQPHARDLAPPRGVSADVAPTDGDLVALIRRGDSDAFALLIRRYQGPFVRYARYMLGNREDAEEAVQDTFVRAYRSIEQCDPGKLGGRRSGTG
jgi:hypothetical protein